MTTRWRETGLALLALLAAACGGRAPPSRPVAHGLDPDHDGIAGDADLCPDDPEDFDGFQDADGCPDPDNDRDGIPDALDQCPNEPETYNGYQDSDGCPDHGCVMIRHSADCIFDPIYFAPASATIAGTYAPFLDAIARSMITSPDIYVVAIVGHRTAAEPVKLAQARADAVVGALVTLGVARDRLVTATAIAADEPARAARVDYEIRDQHFDPATSDDVTGSAVGVVGVQWTEADKHACTP